MWTAPQLPVAARRSQVLAVVLAVCIVAPVFASPALALSHDPVQQRASNNTTTNGSSGSGLEPPSRFIGNGQSDGSSPTNNSTNGSSGNGKKKGGNGIVGGIGSAIGGVGGSVMNPVKSVKSIVNALFGIPGILVKQVNDLIFRIPAPGNSQEPDTWANPESGMWKGVMQFTRFSTVLATVILVFSAGTTFFAKDEYTRRTAWKRWVLGVFAIVLTWTVLPFVLHLANAAARGLRPDNTEML